MTGSSSVAELNSELEAVIGQPVFRLSSCVVLDVSETVQNYTEAESSGYISSCVLFVE